MLLILSRKFFCVSLVICLFFLLVMMILILMMCMLIVLVKMFGSCFWVRFGVVNVSVVSSVIVGER